MNLSECCFVPSHVVVESSQHIEHNRWWNSNPRYHVAWHYNGGFGIVEGFWLSRLCGREVESEFVPCVPYG